MFRTLPLWTLVSLFACQILQAAPKKWVPAYQRKQQTVNAQPKAEQTKPVQKKEEVRSSLAKSDLEKLYLRKDLKKQQLLELKNKTLKLSGKAVPSLIQIMKGSEYPDKNRWVATFLLGRIMGMKAAAFISKFTTHPNWMLRLASLKTLLSLKATKYAPLFVKSLSDKSMLVRAQSLENIRSLKLTQYSPFVWKMLFDKQNYTAGKKGRKRTYVIKKAIRALGDLKYGKAKQALITLMQKDSYKDISSDLDYSLSKMTGKLSPQGNLAQKRVFWSQLKLKTSGKK